jgi:hypothetical protein
MYGAWWKSISAVCSVTPPLSMLQPSNALRQALQLYMVAISSASAELSVVSEQGEAQLFMSQEILKQESRTVIDPVAESYSWCVKKLTLSVHEKVEELL